MTIDHDDSSVHQIDSNQSKLAQIDQTAKGLPFATFRPDLVKQLIIYYLIYLIGP